MHYREFIENLKDAMVFITKNKKPTTLDDVIKELYDLLGAVSIDILSNKDEVIKVLGVRYTKPGERHPNYYSVACLFLPDGFNFSITKIDELKYKSMLRKEQGSDNSIDKEQRERSAERKNNFENKKHIVEILKPQLEDWHDDFIKSIQNYLENHGVNNVDRRVDDAEKAYNEHLWSIAERIMDFDVDVSNLKVEYVDYDRRIFRLGVSDGSHNVYARSIWAAEYSEKVTPHFRFIVTDKKSEADMKKINENTKITLTVGQLKKLVKESEEDYSIPPYDETAICDMLESLLDNNWENIESVDVDYDTNVVTVVTSKPYGGNTFKITVERV